MRKPSKSRHRDAVKLHARRAREHDDAAREWIRRGDSVRAGFEQRAARLERELAELERDHAEHVGRGHPAAPSAAGKT
jgi:hypothetical protein